LNEHDLLKAMSDIRDDFLLEAAPDEPAARPVPFYRKAWFKTASALTAACFLLVVGLNIYRSTRPSFKSEAPAPAQNREEVPAASPEALPAAAPENLHSDQAAGESPVPPAVPYYEEDAADSPEISGAPASSEEHEPSGGAAQMHTEMETETISEAASEHDAGDEAAMTPASK